MRCPAPLGPPPWRRRLLTLLCVLLLPCIAAATEPASAAPAHSAEAAQILVMIRIAPAHYRPDVEYGDGYGARSGQSARRRLAEQIARTHGLRLLSHWPMPAVGVECFVMEAPPHIAAAAAAQAVSEDARAAWAQPLQVFHGQSYNDPLYDQQPTARLWQLDALHAATTGRGVLIAQIDSGAEPDHPDLQGQITLAHSTLAGGGYVAEQHGTAVAGIMVARAGNGVGTVGVAPHATLLALRACREREPGAARCDSLSIAKALQLALDRRARIINLSIAGPPDRLLAELLRAAQARGAIVVAPAAGDGAARFPASQPDVVAVTAAETAGAAAGHAWLAAPGRDVPAPLPGARWGLVSGASFATAEVSGMVALLLQLQPTATASRIVELLRGPGESHAVDPSVTPVPVQACRAVSAAAGHCVCDCAADGAAALRR